jgi:hypothetical protein
LKDGAKMNPLKKFAGIVLAFIIGLIPAFFVNLNSVFSDWSGSLNEYLSIFILIIAIYFLLGLAFGFWGKNTPFVWGLSLSFPTIILLLLYSFSETNTLGQSIINICLTFVSAWVGAKVGIRIKPMK